MFVYGALGITKRVNILDFLSEVDCYPCEKVKPSEGLSPSSVSWSSVSRFSFICWRKAKHGYAVDVYPTSKMNCQEGAIPSVAQMFNIALLLLFSQYSPTSLSYFRRFLQSKLVPGNISLGWRIHCITRMGTDSVRDESLWRTIPHNSRSWFTRRCLCTSIPLCSVSTFLIFRPASSFDSVLLRSRIGLLIRSRIASSSY